MSSAAENKANKKNYDVEKQKNGRSKTPEPKSIPSDVKEAPPIGQKNDPNAGLRTK